MTTILGISAFYHDSAAALIVNGEIIAAAQEERFTRIKHDAKFPQNAINYVLKESNLVLDQIDYVVLYSLFYSLNGMIIESYLTILLFNIF